VGRLLENCLYEVLGSMMMFVSLETTMIIPNFLNIRSNFIYTVFLFGSHSVILKLLCLVYIMFISF